MTSVAKDLLDYIETKLCSDIENCLEHNAELYVNSYYKDMCKDMSQEEIDRIDKCRREYALALVESLLNNDEYTDQ